MVKIVVMNEVDPGIGITLEEVPGMIGWRGTCTECGWPMHRWTQERAIQGAQEHVDRHEPVLIGGDTDALVRR